MHCVCVHVSMYAHTCGVDLCLCVCNVVCSRCGLLLCGWVVVYTIGTHNVARTHAPHCAAAESDFGLSPSFTCRTACSHRAQAICTII